MTDTAGWAGSLDEWRARLHANVTLPSGMRVVIQTVTLDELAADDALPDDLLRVALLEMTVAGVAGAIADELGKADDEALARARKLSADAVALTNRLCVKAVVEPALDEATAAQLDGYDRKMIVEIAQRRIDEDAAGRSVYGVQPLATFPEAGVVV